MDNILSILYCGLCLFIIFMLIRSDFKKMKNAKKYYDNKKIVKEMNKEGSDNNE